MTKRETAIRADEDLLLHRLIKRVGREPTDEERAATRRLAEEMNRPMTAEEKARRRAIARRLNGLDK